MTEQIDLSIIVLSYNVKDLTRNCIQSILDGTENIKYEIIVVDDNSPDNSADMVRIEFPKIRLIVNEKNYRYSKSNNIGLESSQGRYGLLLNCDTIVKPGAFEALVRFMDENPKVDACGPKLLNPDGTIQHCVRGFPDALTLIAQSINLHKIIPNNPITERYYFLGIDQTRAQPVPSIGTTAFLIRRSIWESIGLLDVRFPQLMADQAYCLKLQQAGKKIYYVPFAEVIHLGSQSLNQNSRKAILDLHEELKIFYNVFYAPQNHVIKNWLAHLVIKGRCELKLLENWINKDKRLITGPGAPSQSKKML